MMTSRENDLLESIQLQCLFKDSEQSFKIFVAHSRDLHGMPHSFGKCTLLTIEGIENLVSYLQIAYLLTNRGRSF